MREYKSLVIALIAAVSAVACVSIFTGGLQAVILNLT